MSTVCRVVMKTDRYLVVSFDLSFSLSDDPVNSQQLAEKLMELSERALMLYRNAKMNVGVANADMIQTLLTINKTKNTDCQTHRYDRKNGKGWVCV